MEWNGKKISTDNKVVSVAEVKSKSCIYRREIFDH